MNVFIIPFFLAAKLIVNQEWERGPVYIFQVRLNATGTQDDESFGSTRLNVAARLICQPRGSDVLSCHFRDSTVRSFFSESVDPSERVVPRSMTLVDTYEIGQNQFELKFGDGTLDKIIVSEDIHPRELDMIRSIVAQLNVGTHVDNRHVGSTFRSTEKFVQGECETVFKVDKIPMLRTHRHRRYFELESPFTIEDGHIIEIHKARDLDKCHKLYPYFFGSAEGLKVASDIVSRMTSSDSHIILSNSEFTSSTSSVIKTVRRSIGLTTTLYEHSIIRLESIRPAMDYPPPVWNARSASIFVNTWLMNASEENY